MLTELYNRLEIIASVGGRVYSDEAPSGAELPFITYAVPSEETERSIGGAVISRRANVEIEAVAATREAARAIAAEIEVLIQGFTSASIKVCSVQGRSNTFDSYSKRYGTAVDVLVTY